MEEPTRCARCACLGALRKHSKCKIKGVSVKGLVNVDVSHHTHSHTHRDTPRGGGHLPEVFCLLLLPKACTGPRPAVRGEPGAPQGHCGRGPGRYQKPGKSHSPVCSRPSCCKSWRGEGPGLAVGGYSEAPEPGRSISQMPVPRMYLPRTGAGAFREDFAPRCPSRLGGGDSLPKSREHLTYLVRRTSKNRHEMPK